MMPGMYGRTIQVLYFKLEPQWRHRAVDPEKRRKDSVMSEKIA